MSLHIKINESLEDCLSLSYFSSYLPPLYPSIHNLLIITLIFVLNNMPLAHFLVFSPFIHLSLPRLCQICPVPTVTTVLPTSSPVTKTAPICPFSHRFFALRPFVQPHDIPSSLLSLLVFFPSSFKGGFKKKKKKKTQNQVSPNNCFELGETSADARALLACVCLSLSALFVLWQDYLIVYRV